MPEVAMQLTEYDGDSWGFVSVAQAKCKLSLIGYAFDDVMSNDITAQFTSALADFQRNHGLETCDGSWTVEVATALHGWNGG